MPEWSKERLLTEARETAESMPAPTPPFTFGIGWSESYEHLFSREYRDESGVEALAEAASRYGRVLLHGEAGSGKTSVLQQVYREAVSADQSVIFVNLRHWTPLLFESWKQWEDNDIERMNLLLRELGSPSVDDTAFLALAGDEHLILVDGLNEITSDVAAQILVAVDALARRSTNVGVVVTDRLTRRELPSGRWRLTAVLPLGDDTIAEAQATVGQEPAPTELLRRPFFLNLALHGDLVSDSAASALQAFLRDQARLDQEGVIQPAARAAFEMYATTRSRTFPLADFRDNAGEAATKALLESGIVVADGDEAFFGHHLFHDFFAALWLADRDDDWGRAAFDVISFKASSFDALALALQLVPEAARADELIRRIYDWNFYASAYALAKGRIEEAIAVTDGMEVALLANLAERRWDPILKTAQAVSDSLRYVPGDVAAEMLAAESVAAVQEAVRRKTVENADAEFQRWKELFLIDAGAEVSDELTTRLMHPGSLVGWTAANVLRRAALSATQQRAIRDLLVAGQQVERWRAAHALGAHPTIDNAAALLESLAREEDEWVLYGVIRSLIEEAAVGKAREETEIVKSIIDGIVELIPRLAEQPLTLYELSRAVVLREPPEDWDEAVAPILDALAASAGSVKEQDRWHQVAYEVARSVGDKRAA